MWIWSSSRSPPARYCCTTLAPPAIWHVLADGRGTSLLEHRLDSVRDEGVGRPAVLDLGIPCVVRNDEDWMAERRLVAEPGAGIRILLPWARAAGEHPPAHDR